MLGEAFREFLVLWVVILSQCLDLLPFATWAGSFGLVAQCHRGGHPSVCAAVGCQGTSVRMRGDDLCPVRVSLAWAGFSV